MKVHTKALLCSGVGLLITQSSWASIGTEQSGYGAKNITMEGASVHFPTMRWRQRTTLLAWPKSVPVLTLIPRFFGVWLITRIWMEAIEIA